MSTDSNTSQTKKPSSKSWNEMLSDHISSVVKNTSGKIAFNNVSGVRGYAVLTGKEWESRKNSSGAVFAHSNSFAVLGPKNSKKDGIIRFPEVLEVPLHYSKKTLESLSEEERGALEKFETINCKDGSGCRMMVSIKEKPSKLSIGDIVDIQGLTSSPSIKPGASNYMFFKNAQSFLFVAKPNTRDSLTIGYECYHAQSNRFSKEILQDFKDRIAANPQENIYDTRTKVFRIVPLDAQEIQSLLQDPSPCGVFFVPDSLESGDSYFYEKKKEENAKESEKVIRTLLKGSMMEIDPVEMMKKNLSKDSNEIPKTDKIEVLVCLSEEIQDLLIGGIKTSIEMFEIWKVIAPHFYGNLEALVLGVLDAKKSVAIPLNDGSLQSAAEDAENQSETCGEPIIPSRAFYCYINSVFGADLKKSFSKFGIQVSGEALAKHLGRPYAKNPSIAFNNACLFTKDTSSIDLTRYLEGATHFFVIPLIVRSKKEKTSYKMLFSERESWSGLSLEEGNQYLQQKDLSSFHGETITLKTDEKDKKQQVEIKLLFAAVGQTVDYQSVTNKAREDFANHSVSKIRQETLSPKDIHPSEKHAEESISEVPDTVIPEDDIIEPPNPKKLKKDS